MGRFALRRYPSDDATAIGYASFTNLTSGTHNAGLGRGAGGSVTTGSQNTFVGGNSGLNGSQKVDAVNSTAIGYGSFTTADNQVVLGNEGVSSTILRGNVSTDGDFRLNTGSPIPEGGADDAGLRLSSMPNFGVFYGSGAPTLTCAQGSLYLRSDGGQPNNKIYVNINGGKDWAPLLTAATTTEGYFVSRPFSSYDDVTMGVQSLAYVANLNVMISHIDLDRFPATHYRIVLRGSSSESGETVTLQMDSGSDGMAPAHTGGDDITISHTAGIFDSGWLSRNDGATGFKRYNILCKSSSTTSNLELRFLEVHWKVE
jgi:hypothetical protein